MTKTSAAYPLFPETHEKRKCLGRQNQVVEGADARERLRQAASRGYAIIIAD